MKVNINCDFEKKAEFCNKSFWFRIERGQFELSTCTVLGKTMNIFPLFFQFTVFYSQFNVVNITEVAGKLCKLFSIILFVYVSTSFAYVETIFDSLQNGSSPSVRTSMNIHFQILLKGVLYILV